MLFLRPDYGQNEPPDQGESRTTSPALRQGASSQGWRNLPAGHPFDGHLEEPVHPARLEQARNLLAQLGDITNPDEAQAKFMALDPLQKAELLAEFMRARDQQRQQRGK
jgi:hypothetical protein